MPHEKQIEKRKELKKLLQKLLTISVNHVMKKNIHSLLLTFLTSLMFVCSCQKEMPMEPANMDTTMDFALVDDSLVYCAKDGIYSANLNQLEDYKLLFAYPESYLNNLPNAGKANVSIDQTTHNATLTVNLFKHYGFPITIDLNASITPATSAQNTIIANERGLYRTFGEEEAYIVWPNQFVGPNAIYFTKENSTTIFSEYPYMFGYKGLYPNAIEHNRLIYYQNKLYCLISKYHKTNINYPNIYQLDCLTGDIKPLIDYTVDDFVINNHHLYFLSQNMLYYYDFDTEAVNALTPAKELHCPQSIQDFFTQTSNKTINCSLAAIDNNIFFINSNNNLCLLNKDTPISNLPICFFQQQENYIIAILQEKENDYITYIIDSNGYIVLTLPDINRVSIENNTVFYSNGAHVFNAKISSISR